MGHTSGQKSHATIREELIISTGEEPSQFDVYVKTHENKDGHPVDEASAEVLSKLRELQSQNPESSQSVTLRNQIFSQVMGPERPGRVRTYGQGPTPTEVFGPSFTQSESRKRAIEDEVNTRMQAIRESLREEIRGEVEESIQDKVRADLRVEMEESMRVEINDRFSLLQTEMQSQLEMMRAHMATCPTSGQGIPQPQLQPHLQEQAHSQPHQKQQGKKQKKQQKTRSVNEGGANVDLLNSKIPKEVVARGIIYSKEPSKILGGMQLGREFWEVYIVEVVKPCEVLPLPYKGVYIIGEALGKTMAWRSIDVLGYDGFGDG